jgi:arylformamidase
VTEIYDISMGLGPDTVVYPGDPPVVVRSETIDQDGHSIRLSTLSLSAHAGTHLDAPAHFFPDGKTLDQYPVSRFLVPAVVVEIRDCALIPAEALEGADVRPGDAILFKTDNSRRGLIRSGRFEPGHVAVSPEAAARCVRLGASLVGIDYLSPDGPDATGFPAHRELLSHDVLLLEGIDLAPVPAGSYRLFCAPLKIGGAEASPTRALLATA